MTEQSIETGSEGGPPGNREFPRKWPRVAGVTAVIDVVIATGIVILSSTMFDSIARGTYSPGNVELLSARRVEVMGFLVLANAVISGLATHRFLSERSFVARTLAVISLGACFVFAGFIFLDALITAGQMPGGDWVALNIVYPFFAAVVVAPLFVSGLLHLKALSKLREYAGPEPKWPFTTTATLSIAIGLVIIAVGFGAWQIHAKKMRGIREQWARLQEERAKAQERLERVESGESTQEELIDALSIQDIRVRDEALARLSATGSAGAPAVPGLVEVLKHGAMGNADRAALMLGLTGEPALPVLMDMLGDEEAPVRMRASLGLGEMGSTAASAVPELLRALDDEDEKVRVASRVALGWIDPGSLPAAEQTAGRITIKRISVAADGTQGNGASRYPAVSADGRFVAFYSEATNLVPGDEEGRRDIFVCDLESGKTERIPANDTSYEVHYGEQGPALSADGRFVAFASNALRLIPKSAWRGRKANVSRRGRQGISNIFVCDRETGDIEWLPVPEDVNPAGAGRRCPAISADGRFVAFVGRGLGIYDRQTKSLESHSLGIVHSDGAGLSQIPSISGDGRYVAFLSKASDLVDGDNNEGYDCFVYDREAGTIEGIAVGEKGRSGHYVRSSPAISGDGRFVSFTGDVFTVMPDHPEGPNRNWTGKDLFVHDREDESVQLITVDGARARGNHPALTRDGRFLAYSEWAGFFVHDRESGSVQRVPAGGHGCGSITAGRRIGSSRTAISGDGGVVAFSSENFFLVPGDTNWVEDIFVVGMGSE